MNKNRHHKALVILLSTTLLLTTLILQPTLLADDPDIIVDADADPLWYTATHVATIEEAITAATDGDIILINDSTYHIMEELQIDKNISLLGESEAGVIIHSDSGFGIFEIFSASVTMQNMTLRNASEETAAINVGDGSVDLVFDHLTFTDNFLGISAYNVENCVITNITCVGGYQGVDVSNVENCTITNITCMGGYQGISISNAGNCTIADVAVNTSSDTGISLNDIADSLIFENNILDGNYMGLFLDHIPAESTITGCSFINNTNVGITITAGNNSTIFNNIFKDNVNDVGSGYSAYWNTPRQSGENILGGPFIGGNYWSGYIGIDTDHDGIGDTPHESIEVFYDALPLMLPLPYIQNPYPANASSGVDPIGLVWNVTILDVNNDPIDWSITCSNGQSVNGTGEIGGSKSIDLAADYNHLYQMWVNASDDMGSIHETFWFFTGIQPNHLYVDDDYTNLTNGWGVTHFSSISDSLAVANDHFVIEIYDGEYDDNLIVNKTVTIIGESRDGVKINAAESYFSPAILVEADGVILENLTLMNALSEGIIAGLEITGNNGVFLNLNISNNPCGVEFQDGAKGNTLSFCHLDDNYQYDISLIGSAQENIIHTNHILSNGDNAFYINNSEGNLIYNNLIYSDSPLLYATPSHNQWNISKTPGMNIIDGLYLGGNYWENSDGIGWSQNHSDDNGNGFTDPFTLPNLDIDHLPLVYTENYCPIAGTPTPVPGAIDIPIGDLEWSIPLEDPDSEGILWDITCSNGQSAHSIGEVDYNGLKTLHLTNLGYGTTYTVWVNVTDYYFSLNLVFYFTTISQTIEEPPNTPPVADAGGPYFGYPHEGISFNDGGSYDPDGSLIEYRWVFADGTTYIGEHISHSFLNDGDFTVTLIVTDNRGDTSSDTSTIRVSKANNPPALDISTDSSSGEYSVTLTLTADDPDGDDISYTIYWGDGSTSTTDVLSHGQSTTKTHVYPKYDTYDIQVIAHDGSTSTSYGASVDLRVGSTGPSDAIGFITGNETLENEMSDRSLLGTFIDKDYVLPLATLLNIILLFLLNLFMEFGSDFFSEKVIDRRGEQVKKKGGASVKEPTGARSTAKLARKEWLAVLISTVLFSFVITYAWVPEFSSFWGLFIINLVIIAVLFILRESLRAYWSHKSGMHSRFYVWPLGSVMMIISTLIGNTFALAANHEYGDEDDIKKCGKVSFLIAVILYAIVIAGLLLNMFWHSTLIQLLTIFIILDLFIDMFPLTPMDGYEIRKWNLPIWIVFYALVFITYVLINFNLLP